MKLRAISLLLLFATSTLYPLTDQDWNIIGALFSGGVVIGGTGGALGGIPLATSFNDYIAPTTHFNYSSVSDVTASAATLPTYHTKQQRWEKYVIATFLTSMIGGGIGGGLLGTIAAKKLAIAYIARKYDVDATTAWNAIRYNLDLSAKIKK